MLTRKEYSFPLCLKLVAGELQKEKAKNNMLIFISRQNSGQEILKHAVLQSKTGFILRWVYSKIFLIINCYVYQNASWQAVSLFIHSSKLRLPLCSTCWGIPQSPETHLSMRPHFGFCCSSFRNVLVISCAS